MNTDSRIYVAGHRGMVGSAVVRQLKNLGFNNLLLRTSDEVDLVSQSSVDDFFAEQRPDIVVFAAARVGGIHANSTYPAEFIYQNLAMAVNAVHAAWRHGTTRFLFLGSTCIYPRMAPQPIPEDALMTSPLEATNEAYAVAKIAGLKLCEFYRRQYGVLFHSAMPTNLYGPGDNYHPEHSHVLPALIRRFHEAKISDAKSVTIWGTGEPLREFLHVDDLAAGIIHLLSLEHPPDSVNIGSGQEVSILGLARMVAETVGFTGTIDTDRSRPNGTMRKLSDISRIRDTGWTPKIGILEGLQRTYDSFLREAENDTLRAV
ncbi:MAG: GDP-L-fucose synthase [Fuerstiella sp.]|nr:GDP-L-fucose synthase [Fuerstiella sp.]MCP4508287.1 GDP-L-fucose synthase [Fuerstiella sp.]